MRISDQMMTQNMTQGIDQAQTALARTTEEVSSGVSISEPSDNPVGTGQLLQFETARKQISAWQSNAQAAQSQMQTADQTLSELQNDLSSAESLATEANSGTTTTAQFQDMSQQAQSILNDVASLFNTQYGGQYIFSGTAQEQPVSGPDASGDYSTSAEQNSGTFTAQALEIGQGVKIPTSVNASPLLGGQTYTLSAYQDASTMPQWLQQRGEALGQVAAAGTSVGTSGSPFPSGEPSSTYVDSLTSPATTTTPLTTTSVSYGTSVVDVLGYLQQDLTSGNAAAVEADLGALQSQSETLSSVQAALGANEDRVQSAVSQLEQTSSTLQTQQGSVENVDMAQLISQLTAQQTAYQAAVAAAAQMKLPTLANYLT